MLKNVAFAFACLVVSACAKGEEFPGGSSQDDDGDSNSGGNDGDGNGGAPQGGSNGEGATQAQGGNPSTGGGDSCGNGNIDAGEDCDGVNVGGATCTSIGQGFTGGALACANDCTYDTSGCTAPAGCGNGNAEGTEACDGADLNGQSCATQGFDGGTLTCNGSCTGFITSGCTNNCSPVNLLVNQGFESGPNGGGWLEHSDNFGSPVCDAGTCGTGGSGPSAGVYWTWFGGTITADEFASMYQTVVIPQGTATLSFQFDIPSCEDPGTATDQFLVGIDGTLLYSATNSDPGCGVAGYQLIMLDVSQYADGAAHTLQFEGLTADYGTATNFMFDDVRLMGCQ
ncbi:MAG: hypothetical protein HOW73_18515 [Polyangiaceae bacterium]|nr:hypothetical protein [Polyangiaceae bacterium]